jgi:TP901 family phage tail tape measure protein
LQGALTAVGVAAAGMAVAIGVEAVNKASAFQNAMLQNVAHAGLAKNQFDAVSKSVLQMSTDVGQMPTDLAQGLYPILSGFSGITNESSKAQTALEDLRLAAEDVVGTETKTTVTSGALTSAFNALGLQTNNTSTNISRLKTLNDQMEATVIAGNMHWDQYANVVGKLATAIKGTSVRWVEASSALATMTNEGFTAQRSQTYLANLFTQMELKTDSLAKNAMKLGGAYTYVATTTKTLAGHTVIWHGMIGHTADRIETLHKTVHATFGIGFDEAKFKTMSLADQLDYLTKITHGNQSELLKLFNNNATALKTYNALESGMKSYKTNLDAITHSQGATQKAFDVASSSFDAAKNRMAAAINVLLINLGTQLLPVLSKVLDWVTPLIKKFADWVVNSKDLHIWLNNVGSFLQYQFLPALQNTVQWFQQGGPAVDAVKVGLAGVGVAIGTIKTVEVIKGLDDAVTKLGNMKNTAMEFMSWFKSTFIPGMNSGKKSVEDFGTASEVSSGEVTALGTAAEDTAAKETVMGNDALVASGEQGVGGLTGAVTKFFNVVGPVLGIGLLTEQLSVAIPILTGQAKDPGAGPHPTLKHYHGPHSYASGVTNFSGGLAYVHQGEVLSNLAPGTNVTPASRVSLGGGPVFNISISTLAGSRSEVIRMVDLIEAEMASRFRGQTSYGFGGIV